ncbi:poly-gamma-glutamate biosynthesis protein PgsC [Prosthecomicrobium sp. N25]|uniref:poly-gamma-glutamate biosynthesis protein PgsC n=1 Tax=Prosthecomicrobium sp. N25 TaxID=3129254 RepID=UPI003076CF91
MLTAALVIGVPVSLLVTEVIGLTAGGIIVPGYVALLLDRPAALLGFFLVSLACFGLVRLLQRHLVLFGSRAFAVTVLAGLALSLTADWLVEVAGPGPIEWAGLGYIVPGLVAHQFDRQGILPTLAALAIAAAATRIILVLAVRL